MIETAEEFYRLRKSSDKSEYLRAANEEAPLQVWLDTIEKYPDMRFWIAQNKTVPLEVLEILAQDSDSNVRSMVAQKGKLPKKLQLILAKDPEFSVRMHLAHNKKATAEILKILMEDIEPKIKDFVQQRLKKLRS